MDVSGMVIAALVLVAAMGTAGIVTSRHRRLPDGNHEEFRRVTVG
jgi:hypothetical protein